MSEVGVVANNNGSNSDDVPDYDNAHYGSYKGLQVNADT